MANRGTHRKQEDWDRRRSFSKGLRELATFLTRNPDVPLPELFMYEYVRDANEWTTDKRTAKEKLKAIARAVVRKDGRLDKNGDESNLTIKTEFAGGIRLKWNVTKEQTCTARVVGQREEVVYEYEKKAVGTKVVDVVEWDCGPILGGE
jgi:hypothetical protein